MHLEFYTRFGIGAPSFEMHLIEPHRFDNLSWILFAFAVYVFASRDLNFGPGGDHLQIGAQCLGGLLPLPAPDT